MQNKGSYVDVDKKFILNYICAKNKVLFDNWFNEQAEKYKQRINISEEEFKNIIKRIQ